MTLAPSNSNVLEVVDVSVHFGGVKAVDHVSIVLEPGRIYGILGPNGSGKSTLLGAITRLVNLTSGILKLDGVEYHHQAASFLANRGVARTFQTVRLVPDLTVRENVQLGADLHRDMGRQRSSNRESRKRAAAAMELTGATGISKLRPSELSYGAQRRVEIARALAMEPRLLLLDEPTAGMNQYERGQISTLMKDLRSQGLTQLLVEHDVQMMIDTCDFIYAMNSGALIAQGDPRSVVRDRSVQEAYLGKEWVEHAGDQ